MLQHTEMRHEGENQGAPPGARYEVDGRRLLLHRSGSGGPTVVFLPGAGLVGLDFLNIHDQISAVTTSVLYDRAGAGWSDEVRLPRSAAEVAGELRALLRAAGAASLSARRPLAGRGLRAPVRAALSGRGRWRR